MDTTNTTQHNAHDHVIPKDDFHVTYQLYENKKKTQELKIPIDSAKKYLPRCPCDVRCDCPEDSSGKKKHEWHKTLTFENESGQARSLKYKYWRSTGYVLHGEDWNAYRDEVKLEAGDVLWFTRDQKQKNKYFVKIQKKLPTEQDGGRAANCIPRITTGHHETYELVRDKGKRPLENNEEEAPRNIRPNHGILSGETRAETNRSSLADTELEEHLLSILTVMKLYGERIQKLEALVEGAKIREEALMSIISILKAQVQASQNSSVVIPELEQSQANVPPHSSRFPEEDDLFANLNGLTDQDWNLLLKWDQLSRL